jgi:hypothetical protein
MSRLGIEPELSLAFSVRSGPGTYAILLGSGVSRAAGVPTGWEVTLNLVRTPAAPMRTATDLLSHQESRTPSRSTASRCMFGSTWE